MTSDQKALLEKAERSLDAARILRDRELFDDAVSRMHYAMFHAAKALLTVSPGKNLRKHTAVIAAFGEYWSKTGRIEPEYHRYLLQAFNARNKADYVLGQTHSAEDAQRFYLYAEAMIRRVRQLLES